LDVSSHPNVIRHMSFEKVGVTEAAVNVVDAAPVLNVAVSIGFEVSTPEYTAMITVTKASLLVNETELPGSLGPSTLYQELLRSSEPASEPAPPVIAVQPVGVPTVPALSDT